MGTTPEPAPGGVPPGGRQFLGLGIEMVMPIVLLMYAGYRLDAWLGSDPWLFLVGALLGIVIGFYTMLKRVGALGRRNGEP